MSFITSLIAKQPLMAWFGLIHGFLVMAFVVLAIVYPMPLQGVNGWFKPIKFALSIGTLSLTLAWLTGFLGKPAEFNVAAWILVISLGFEMIYIGWQAFRGQASHFNVSTPFYSFMYSLMAIGATVASLVVAYYAFLFFTRSFPVIDTPMLWAIRWGCVLCVVFSFEGFVMGSRLSHTIGGADGSPGLFFLGWSKTLGDPRVAHFVGMHALQVLPMLAHFVVRNKWTVFVMGLCYAVLAGYTLRTALKGKPMPIWKQSTLEEKGG